MTSATIRRLAAPIAGACGLWVAAVALAEPVAQDVVVRVNPDVANDQAAGGVGMAADGRFAVAYYEQAGGHYRVFVRLYTADGTAAPTVIPVNTGDPSTEDRTAASVAMDATGGFVVTYMYTASFVSSIRAQRFDATGTPVGSELLVSAAGGRQNPRVAMAPDGRFAIVWDHEPDIEARVYGADGVPVDTAFVVDQSGASRHPDIAMDSAGRSVVVWERSTTLGDPGHVPARRYSALGVAAGGEFDAFTGDTNENYPDPTVGLADDGRFTVVVAGRATASGSGILGILGQRVNPADTAAGTIFRVNPSFGSTVLQPAALMDPDGDLNVAYEDQSGGGGKLYVRHYTADGTVDGDQVLIGGGGSFNPHARLAGDGAGRLAVAFTANDTGSPNFVGAFTRRVVYASPTATTTTTTTTTSSDPPTTTATPPPPTSPPTTATPSPTLPALPSFSAVVTLPGTKTCVSRRSFRIHIRKQRGVTLKSAEVKVNGKRVKVVSGARLTAPIDLRTLPKGRFTVQIVATTSDGRKIKGTRKYRTCAKKKSGTLKKPL